MAEKDKRLDILNEILAGIKIIKMYAWEVPFINKVQTIRERETDFIRKYLLGQTMISFVWYCSPFLVSSHISLIIWSPGNFPKRTRHVIRV